MSRATSTTSAATAHTDGPWIAVRNGMEPWPHVVAEDGTVVIKAGGFARDSEEGSYRREAMADATLAAAAPALLDALRTARGVIADDRAALVQCHTDPTTGRVDDSLGLNALRGYDNALAKIDDAIAAATGEKQP